MTECVFDAVKYISVIILLLFTYILFAQSWSIRTFRHFFHFYFVTNKICERKNK